MTTELARGNFGLRGGCDEGDGEGFWRGVVGSECGVYSDGLGFVGQGQGDFRGSNLWEYNGLPSKRDRIESHSNCDDFNAKFKVGYWRFEFQCVFLLPLY